MINNLLLISTNFEVPAWSPATGIVNERRTSNNASCDSRAICDYWCRKLGESMHVALPQLAKIGDLVEYSMCWSGLGKNRSEPCNMTCCATLAIIIEVIDDIEVPQAYRLLWSDGRVEKEWADELSVISIT